MAQPIYLVCGVPGSGKTWTCKQLVTTGRWEYVPHDEYPVADYAWALADMAKRTDKPILGEAPFRISVLIAQLVGMGCEVKPYFIIEPDYVIKQRYESREGKPIPKQHITRIKTVALRARELGIDWGNSREILEILQKAA